MQSAQTHTENKLVPIFMKDNGKEGEKAIARTPTGLKTVVFGFGTAEEVTLELKREVDLDGNPYIEIELDGLDEDARMDVLKKLENALINQDYHEGL